MVLLALALGCASPQPCKCPPPRDCRAWKEKVDLLKEELLLERVKVARLRSLLALEEARERPLPPSPRSPREALNRLFSSESWVPPLYRQAMALAGAGRHREALEKFGAFLAAHPHHPLADDALYFMAQEALALGDRERALALLKELVEEYPQGDRVSQARLKMGLILVDKGKIKEGESEIEKVLEGSPYSLGALEAETLLEREGR